MFETRWKKTIATKVRRIDFNKSIANCENRSKSSSKWCPRYSLRRFLNNFRGKVNIFFGGCAYLDPPRAPNRVLSRPSSNGLVWRERDNEKRKISCNSFVIRWRQYLVEKIIQKFIRNVYLKLIIQVLNIVRRNRFQSIINFNYLIKMLNYRQNHQRPFDLHLKSIYYLKIL